MTKTSDPNKYKKRTKFSWAKHSNAKGGTPAKGLDLVGNCITTCSPNWCF